MYGEKEFNEISTMFEIFREDYECNLYIDADADISTFLQNIATLINASDVESDSVHIHEGDVLISKNENYHCTNKKSPEDGFLFYRYKLLINPNRTLGKKNAINLVTKLLNYAWSEDYPAVAACNYESELPNDGGYKSENVPTPK